MSRGDEDSSSSSNSKSARPMLVRPSRSRRSISSAFMLILSTSKSAKSWAVGEEDGMATMGEQGSISRCARNFGLGSILAETQFPVLLSKSNRSVHGRADQRRSDGRVSVVYNDVCALLIRLILQEKAPNKPLQTYLCLLIGLDQRSTDVLADDVPEVDVEDTICRSTSGDSILRRSIRQSNAASYFG